MKKIVFAFLVAMLCVMVSCDTNQEIASGVVDVKLSADTPKNLTSSVDSEIKYWEFMATPKFTLAEGEKIYGIVSYWKDLSDLTTGDDSVVKTSCTLGRYTSGDWYFEVRALNAQHKVVAIGSHQQIIREGLDNTIHINMYVDRADGTHGESADRDSAVAGSTTITSKVGNGEYTTDQYGSLKVGFFLNRLDESVSNLGIDVYRQKVQKDGTLAATEQIDNISWTVLEGVAPTKAVADKVPAWYDATTPDIGEGKLYYGCELTKLDAGPYIYTFRVKGKNTSGEFIVLGGQAVDVLVVGGEETQIKGTLLANEYVLAGLKVTAPGMIVGTIAGHPFIKNDDLSKKVTLKYELDANLSAEKPKKYFWYVDGVLTETTSDTYEFTCPVDSNGNYVYGIYRISCSPTGELGSIGNAVIDVICNPKEGPNVGEFDWSSVTEL